MISRLLLLCIALLLPQASAHAQEKWASYHNSRFGTAIEYPARFKPGRPPDNNDGQSFAAEDGATLAVWGSLNIEERDIPQWEAFLRESPEKSEQITYRAAGKNWLVLSGTRADKIFYTRYLFSHRNEVINGFEINYPAALAAGYGPIVARLSKSLRPGRGYQVSGAP